MKRLFLAMLSVLVMATVVSGGKALAGSDDGGFCRSISPEAQVCPG